MFGNTVTTRRLKKWESQEHRVIISAYFNQISTFNAFPILLSYLYKLLES